MFRFAFTFMLILFAGRLYAQLPVLKNIARPQWLASEKILKCAEDGHGNIWMATTRGIVKYDGKRFRQFGVKDGLTENQFYFVSKDRNSDTLYFISYNFKLFTYANGSFSAVKSTETICWMTYDEQGIPYFLTRIGEVFTLQNGRLVYYFKYKTPWTIGAFYHLEYAGEGRFLLSWEQGIEVLSAKKERSELIRDPLSYNNKYKARVFNTGKGRFILFTEKGLYTVNAELSEVRLAFAFPQRLNDVVCMYRDPVTDDLWTGTFSGLWRFRKGILDDAHRDVFLAETHIGDLFFTSEKLLIVSTYDDGLYTTSLNSVKYNSSSLKGRGIDFIKSSHGKIYVFLSDGDIYTFRNGIFKPENIPTPLRGHNKTRYVFQRDSTLVILPELSDGNAFRIHNNNIRLISQYPRYEALQEVYLSDTFTFLEKYGNGIRSPKYNLSISEAFIYSVASKLISVKGFRGSLMMVDRKERKLYYATNQGYLVQDFGNMHKFASYDLGSTPSSLIRWSDGLKIAATDEKGLAFIRSSGTTFMGEEDGLTGDLCKGFRKDGDCLWVLTDKGISKIVIRSDTVVSVTSFNENNMLLPGVNDFCINGDDVYVACDSGLVTFSKDFTLKSRPPSVMITKFSVNNIDTVLSGTYVLPYDQNNISISYSYASLIHAGKVFFRHVLRRNGDTISVSTTQEDNMQLFSLSSGNYDISVSVMDGNGTWGSPKITYIKILPVFWRSWWFIMMVSLALAAMIIFAALYRIRMNKKESELRNLLTESELKALRLHMNPHFMFNTLNSLQRFILRNDPLAANDYISKFSQLLRWVIIYSDRQQLTLGEEIDFLTLYTQLEQFRSEGFLLDLHIDPGTDIHSVYIPSLVIQPFVENAIKYGLTDHDKGMLELRFSRNESFIFVSIRDNGPGREKVKKDQERSVRPGNDTGIRFTEERLRLLIDNKKISPVKITDLYDNEMNAKGTLVELMVPIII